jgi:hypothetical protein
MSPRVSTTTPPEGPSLPPFTPSVLRPEFRSEEFWESNTRRFKAFAAYCLSKHTSHHLPGLSPLADEANDVVVRATILILEGVRRCPEDVSPVSFVLGVIASITSHDFETAEARTMHLSIAAHEQDGDSVISDLGVESSEADLIARNLAEDFIGKLPLSLRRYVRLRQSGMLQTAEDYAHEMGVSVADVRKIDRRLRRQRSLWTGTPPSVDSPGGSARKKNSPRW